MDCLSKQSSGNWKPAQTWLSSVGKMIPHPWWDQRTKTQLQVLQGSPGFSQVDLLYVSPHLGRENQRLGDRGVGSFCVFHIMQMICKLIHASTPLLSGTKSFGRLSARMEQGHWIYLPSWNSPQKSDNTDMKPQFSSHWASGSEGHWFLR